MKMIFIFALTIMQAMALPGSLARAAGEIDMIEMKEVRRLAKLQVDEILEGVSLPQIDLDHYSDTLRNRNRPLIVFFYINKDGASQRVATLIRYIVPAFSDRLDFRRVNIMSEGKPGREQRKELQARFSLDDIPGILYYDNVGSEMVLEDEDYVNPDFKEFRTPSMLFWKTYYSVVQKELNKLLAD